MDKILIIEDDKEIIETLSELLTLEGYGVISAESGKEGIIKAGKEKPDLIVCDIMMPGISGYDVLETLRNNPENFLTPFVFLTAKSEKENLRLGMDLGADDYITKPYDDSEILNAIESRLKKRHNISDAYDKRLDEFHNYIASSLPGNLRSPLNTIIGFTQILKNRHKELSENDINKMYDNIIGAGKRLLELIVNHTYYSTLISLSENEEKYPEEITRYSQTIIYNKALEIAKKHSRMNDLSLDLDDLPVKAADSHISKIVEELADNAFKYSEEGSKVLISACSESGNFCLKAVNEGPGLTESQIAQISPFVQFAKKGFEEEGAGLGLAIVKKITDICGGSFDIKSKPYGKTIVKVCLPKP